jgi:hypothetical protein|tara:strand:- start:257 stop:730 length:474 start_codon:yes stop_codon:yes gene_type:complete
MATWTITGGGNTGHSADGKKVRVISEIVDFSEFTISTNDVIQVIELPANSLVLYAGLDVLTADSAGNSGTLSLGDGADVDRYVSASTATAGIETTRERAGDSSLGTTSIGYAYYAAADTIDLVNATGSINAKVRVFAVVADCDGLGDTEGQNVTFST